jgi:hypothetical protein
MASWQSFICARCGHLEPPLQRPIRYDDGTTVTAEGWQHMLLRDYGIELLCTRCLFAGSVIEPRQRLGRTAVPGTAAPLPMAVSGRLTVMTERI